MGSQTSNGSARFAGFELDLRTGELKKNGRRVRLQAQPLKALRVLLEHPGELVTREQLRKEVWPQDTFVDFDHGLNKAVAKLRDAVDESDTSPSIIETLPRLGYRLIPPVEWVAREPEPNFVVPQPETPESEPKSSNNPAAVVEQQAQIQPRRLKRWALGVAAALALVLAVGTVVRLKYGDWARKPGDPIRSLAVLPLQNLSGDPSQEYFADGTTEELITTLARLSDLRVTSRTSVMQFKGAQKSAKEIGRALGVDAIVEGSIARSADKVRITVQLIDAKADRHLWANEYESSPSDALRLQQEVALEIASQVSAQISPQQRRNSATARAVDPKAHDLYLRARQYAAQWNDPAMSKAMDLYQKAIALQPDYAAAYVGLADAHAAYGIWGDEESWEAWPKVREAALKALSLDSSVPGAHKLLASVKHTYDWDTAGAQEEFQAAFKTDRNDAETQMTYGLFLAQIGRVDEGLAEAQLAEELDPLSSRISGTKEKVFMIARRYDDVFKQAQRTRELNPNSMVTTLHVLETYQILGRYEDAIREFETHPDPGSTEQETTAFAKKLRIALRSKGPKGYWEVLLQDRLDTQADDHCLLGYVYLRTGDRENGYHQLDLAIQGRDRNLRQMKTHPMWDFVRNEERFQDVSRRVGF